MVRIALCSSIQVPGSVTVQRVRRDRGLMVKSLFPSERVRRSGIDCIRLPPRGSDGRTDLSAVTRMAALGLSSLTDNPLQNACSRLQGPQPQLLAGNHKTVFRFSAMCPAILGGSLRALSPRIVGGPGDSRTHRGRAALGPFSQSSSGIVGFAPGSRFVMRRNSCG
jgi:hypothetical protein